jgi:phosphate:Na+ symporter
MTWWQVLFSAVSAVILFLFSLQSFSHELQEAGGETLRTWLGRVTASRWQGLLAGAAATALVQSSSAVTALAVTLVDAGVISFKASLGILLGANIGTTTTAWLVSFKLTDIGPYFIVAGALVSLLPFRFKFLGKAIFYFGVIFFALNLVSDKLKPLSDAPVFQEWLGRAEAPWLGVLIGLAFTALVQSSSVTTGLAILLVQQGVLPAVAAIPIVVGSNIGTTSTGLIASLGMKPVARATAAANLFFNAAGVLIYFPFLRPFSRLMVDWFGAGSMSVAWAHLIFNVTVGLAFLLLLDKVEPMLSSRFRLGAASPETKRATA